MTVERRFTCNFCGGDVFDCRTTPIAGRKPGTGIKWADDSTTQVRRCSDTECHICIVCLKALRAMQPEDLKQWQVQ